MEDSRAENFFQGKEVQYEAVRRNIDVRVFMKNAKKRKLGRRTDYDYQGEMRAVWRGETIMEASFSSPFTFFKEGSFGQLFHDLTGKAYYLHKGLIFGGGERISRDLISECLFEIRNQAEGEFFVKGADNRTDIRPELYEKYFARAP